MADVEVIQALQELKQVTAAQTVAMTQMLGILATQTNMLQEVLKTLTAEPTGESPLMAALKQLIGLAETHTAVLEQIENTLHRQTMRRPSRTWG